MDYGRNDAYRDEREAREARIRELEEREARRAAAEVKPLRRTLRQRFGAVNWIAVFSIAMFGSVVFTIIFSCRSDVVPPSCWYVARIKTRSSDMPWEKFQWYVAGQRRIAVDVYGADRFATQQEAWEKLVAAGAPVCK